MSGENKMRKLGLLIVLFLMILPAAAQDANVVISWPPPVYDVTGMVDVRGTVNPPDLQAYFLEVGAVGEAVSQWTPVTLPKTAPVIDGVIDQWLTSLVPDGVYQLRLHVQLRSGQSVFAMVGPIRVANELQRPTGETVITPPVAQPVATEEAAAEPELVPRPNPVNDLPIPVGGQVTYFTDATAALMKNAGMTWVKWQIPYSTADSNLINVARDRINWSHKAGFNVLLSITGIVDELAAQGDAFYPVYAEFLGQVAAMHPDAIEVWNEMNLDREWPQGKIDPVAYTEMLRQAHDAIKAADPDVKVITGALAPTGAEGAFGLARVWNDDRYYQGMANAGVAQYADCIGVHYNEGIIAPQQQGGDPRQPDYPTRYLPLMIQRASYPFRDQNIPLCFTELGYLSPEGYGPLPSGFAWAVNTSVQEQALWLHDAIQVAAQMSSAKVNMIIVFNVDFDRYDKDDPQAGYAIIRADGTCPACDQLTALRGGRG
jgi:hypothetical protein